MECHNVNGPNYDEEEIKKIYCTNLLDQLVFVILNLHGTSHSKSNMSLYYDSLLTTIGYSQCPFYTWGLGHLSTMF